jgi:Flp pilus assembly protein TadB
VSDLWPLVVLGAAPVAAALAVPPRRTPGHTPGGGARSSAPPPGSGAGAATAGLQGSAAVGPAPPVGRPAPTRVVATAAVAVGASLLVGGAAGLVAGCVAAACCWWLTGRMEPPAVRRRRERLAAGVPHAVDLLAACLAAGLSPEGALEQVAAVTEGPLAEELEAVYARLRLGVDPATVWRDLAGHPQLGALGRTVSRAAESGASVADAMVRLSGDLRRQQRAQVETRARAVGVKAAVPLGVCLLPAFVLVGVVPLVAGSLSVLVP